MELKPQDRPSQVSGLATDVYEEILCNYLTLHSEEALHRVSLLSQHLIEDGRGPDDIMSLHFESLDRVLTGHSARRRARFEADAQEFLLEVMIAYGLQVKEHLEMRVRESRHDTEQELNRERQNTRDAERLGRQKDELLTVIAHELRTPITAAQGNVELARRYLTRGDADHAARLLDSARRAMERLSQLSRDLVEANRDESPKIFLDSLELGPILSRAVEWARLSGDAEELNIRIEPDDTPLFICGNEDALLSVFGNLLSNAVRYTHPGGTVTLSRGTDGSYAWVEVADTGIGMAPEVQARAFEKFYRAPQAREMELQGLGLGLSLVKKLVEAHEGQIDLQSMEGVGTTFRVTFPLRNVTA